jgi:hypothetical protein
MEYIIVQQASLEDQMKAVNLRLEAGWECVGGLCSMFVPSDVPNSTQMVYTQAMIKKPYKDPFRTGMP